MQYARADRSMASATRRGAFALALVLAACAAPGPSVPASIVAAAPSAPVPVPTKEPSAAPTPTPEPTPLPSILGVSAFANIFGAGRTSPPSPGGGGAGVLPPEWPLPAGAKRSVTFPQVTGLVYGRIGQAPANGPEGESLLGTDVTSFNGISGIVHGKRAMFLVGVFLTDDPPANPSPKRLDFTNNEDFELLKPEIGQTFLIGDGVGRRYQVPAGATRLFLGFAEAMFYVGQPGFYGNNSGALEVTIKTTIE